MPLTPKEMWDIIFPPRPGDRIEVSLWSGRKRKHITVEARVLSTGGIYPRRWIEAQYTDVQIEKMRWDQIKWTMIPTAFRIRYHPRRVKILKRAYENEAKRNMGTSI